MNGIGYSIRLFFGMILFIPQLILALIVGIGKLFPEGTFGTAGAVALSGTILNFMKEIIEEPEVTPTTPMRKPRATAKRKPRAKKKP